MTYLTDNQLAARYSVHRCTIWRWVRENNFPQPVKLMGSSRWRLADVEIWEASQ